MAFKTIDGEWGLSQKTNSTRKARKLESRLMKLSQKGTHLAQALKTTENLTSTTHK